MDRFTVVNHEGSFWVKDTAEGVYSPLMGFRSKMRAETICNILNAEAIEMEQREERERQKKEKTAQ